MFSPTSRHIVWKTSVEPVKWMPASSGWLSTLSEISDALPLTMLITPGGIPASSKSSTRKWLTSSVWVAGLKMTVLPMSIGAVGRLPAIEVKLNGLTAKMKPSSGRYSRRFVAVGGADVRPRRATAPLAADLHRHLGPGVGQLGEARLERLAVRVAGRVGADGLVAGLRNLEMSVGGHLTSSALSCWSPAVDHPT